MTWFVEAIDSLQQQLLLAIPATPLLLLLGLGCRRWGGWVASLAHYAALPALLAALVLSPGARLDLPWLLLGCQLQVSDETQVFLLFTALLWLLCGLYARGYLAEDPRRQQFMGFFLAAMSGNLGLLLCGDLLSFFLFFALMSFASYGLVVHNRDPLALRAGRIYLILVLLGEVLLFCALLLMADAAGGLALDRARAAVAGSPHRDTIVLLLLAGFGIKAGVIPLHVWLPLAHPAAPTPASAVLSGAMIKTGLFGLMKFLPLGLLALPGWGSMVIGTGVLMAFYGVTVGLTQQHPKVILAYSSISQMGFLMVGLGLALGAPQSWPALASVLGLYALHHGLAKGALFLGIGMAPAAALPGFRRWLVWAGLVLPAMALAGAPLTSGALAKTALKAHTKGLPVFWSEAVGLLLALAAMGTTLLMLNFIYRVWSREVHGHRPSPYMWLCWGGLCVATAALAWGLPQGWPVRGQAFALAGLWGSFWPVGLGLMLGTGAWVCRGIAESVGRWQIPSGDLLVWMEALGRWAGGRRRRGREKGPRPGFQGWGAQIDRGVFPRLERSLGSWPVAGTLFLLLFLAQVCLLAWP